MTPGNDAGGRTRTALVTGGTGGIGGVIAATLAADGFDVAVGHAGSIGLADAMISEIEEHGRRGAAFAADIANSGEVSALFDAAEDHLGPLDVVVHTAGINWRAVLADLDLAEFDEIHRVSVRRTVVVCQQAARRVSNGGSIVTVSSSMVKMAPAVDVLTRILAQELRGRNITVNAVAPVPTATVPFPHSTVADARLQLTSSPGLGRLGDPRDIAGVVSFLVSPTGRWVNGQVVYANGRLV